MIARNGAKLAFSKFNSIVSAYDQRNLKYGLAISGGVDSMALAYLVKNSVISERCYAIIVDHGLRDESSIEAEIVYCYLQSIGYSPEILQLKWLNERGYKNQRDFSHSLQLEAQKVHEAEKNAIKYSYYSSFEKPSIGPRLEEMARMERYKAVEILCKRNSISYLVTGHHRDDLSETFLMRLSRQSGLIGLAGMRILDDYPIVSSPFSKSLKIFRPLLFDYNKQDLVELCTNHQVSWVEDPSNTNVTFKRNSIRKIIHESKKSSKNYNQALFTEKIFPVVIPFHLSAFFTDKIIENVLENIAKFDPTTGECSWVTDNAIFLSILSKNQTLLHLCLSKTIKWVTCSAYPPKLKDVQLLASYLVSKHENLPPSVCSSGVLLFKPTKKQKLWIFSKQILSNNALFELDYIGIDIQNQVLWNSTTFINPLPKIKDSNLKYSVISLARALGLCSEHSIDLFRLQNKTRTAGFKESCLQKSISLNPKQLLQFFKTKVEPSLQSELKILNTYSLFYQPMIIVYKPGSATGGVSTQHISVPCLNIKLEFDSNMSINFVRKV